VLFDHEYDLVYSCTPVRMVPELTEHTYLARGSTALYDAVGRTINDLGARLAAMPEDERPEKVVVVINTDGQENNSREFSADRLRQMIEHQRDVYKWEFLFMGADQDAWESGSAFGMQQGKTLSYDKTAMEQGMRLMSSTVATYRTTGTLNVNDTDIRSNTVK
jgi:hypothetical protein